MTRATLGGIVRIAVAAILIFFAVRFLLLYKQELFRIANVEPLVFVSLAVLNCILLLNASLMLKFSLSSFGIQPAFKHWFGIVAVGGMLNYVLPFSPGLIAKGGYLKRKFGLRLASFSAIQSANAAFVAVTASVLALLSLSGVRFSNGKLEDGRILYFFMFCLVLPLLVMFIPIRKSPWSGFFSENINKIIEGFTLIRNDKRLRWRIPGLAFCNIAISFLLLAVSFEAFALPRAFFPLAFLASISNLSNLVQITPGNFGISEAAIGFGAFLQGMSMGDGLTIALLCRLANIVVCFTFGFVFSIVLGKDL